MGSLVSGSTAMKTLFLTLLILTTVNCDSLTTFTLLKAEGVVNAYDEYGAVVDAFKPQPTVVKDVTEETANVTTNSGDTCNPNYRKYIEAGRGSKWTSHVRSSSVLECDANGPNCELSFSVSHTETAHFSMSVSATWKNIIGGTIGADYSKSTTYSKTETCSLYPGQCAYMTVSSHDGTSHGRTKETGACIHQTCNPNTGCVCHSYACDYKDISVTWGKKLGNGKLDGHTKCHRFTTDKPHCGL